MALYWLSFYFYASYEVGVVLYNLTFATRNGVSQGYGSAEVIPMSTSFPTLPNDKAPKKESFVCLICGKPVPVESAKTDADGQAVHEDCYALKLLETKGSDSGAHDIILRPQ